MIPVVTPQQMTCIDAVTRIPSQVLIARAGAAVAKVAEQMMGGRYGRRVVVLAGKGNNGNDGRVAAEKLRNIGVRVEVVEACARLANLKSADLYIDAAFGTGLSRPWAAPCRTCLDAPVLAVDIPSGLNGLNGSILGGPVWRADRTVTFAAYKPGMLLEQGPKLCGDVTVADIGLNVGAQQTQGRTWDSTWANIQGSTQDNTEKLGITTWQRCDLILGSDIRSLPTGDHSTHKWQNAVLVVAGSRGMCGAAKLVCAASLRSGARMVHLNAPDDASYPVEVVRSDSGTLASDLGMLTSDSGALAVDSASVNVSSAKAKRYKAAVVGPGLGLDGEAVARMRNLLELDIPLVIDADGLTLMGHSEISRLFAKRRALSAFTVLTPHEGERRTLMRGCVSDSCNKNKIDSAREVAEKFHAVVVLKGAPTVVSDPQGNVIIVNNGDSRLATAGTGDVLAGMIAGRIAAFASNNVSESNNVSDTLLEALICVAEAVYLHGKAAAEVSGSRLIASDIIDMLRYVTL